MRVSRSLSSLPSPTFSGLYARLGVLPAYWPAAGWVAPVLVVALAGLLRFWNLAHPGQIVFDETYYVKDSASLLHFGYERAWPENADDSFAAGTPVSPENKPSYVVHPPLGKWMIAVGMWMFGTDNPLGWRFSSALVGTLSVAVLIWVGWLLFRSVTLASIAGLLLAVDGLHLVQSRLALLDIFLMFWLLLAFAFLVADRRQARRRLAARLLELPDSASSTGPWLGVRWWRLAAGLCCGAAVGVKWNALFFIAAFGILTVIWDASARHRAGIRRWLVGALLKDSWLAFLSIVGIALVTYLVTWTGWFLSADAYHRHWAEKHPGEGLSWLPASLRSLAEYHRSAFAFHQGLDSDHSYQSSAWDWLILARPTSYYYESFKEGAEGCSVEKCSEAILNIGNPLIWWTAALAMILVLVWAVWFRDGRFAGIFWIFAVGYFPWFLYPERTTFYFYALSFLPWLILGLAGVLGLALGRPEESVRRRKAGVVVIGVFLVLTLLVSAHFWPIWTGQMIPYETWRDHMWFERWI